MDNNFTVIKSDNSENETEMKRIYRIALLNESWERQFFSSINEAYNNGHDTINNATQSELMKIGLAGVKYICSSLDIKRENKRLGIDEPATLDEVKAKYQLFDFLFSVLGGLTLRNFVTTFPITKEYDGAKWESKDYFYTMDVLSSMDWDQPIGRDNVFDLLWDYVNHDLRKVNVEYTNVLSAAYRSQTGKGIMEQFCEDNGIATFSVDRDTGFMVDNKTGEISRFRKQSHIQVVK